MATCALFNARSLSNKLPDFHDLLSRNYSMVFVTESWLRNSIVDGHIDNTDQYYICLLYTSPSPRDGLLSRMPSSA